jgi:hypothetical protein
MADHIAAAQRYRARAAKCELSAKNTSSAGFGECYRLLAQHYLALAVSKKIARIASRLSPGRRMINPQRQRRSARSLRGCLQCGNCKWRRHP